MIKIILILFVLNNTLNSNDIIRKNNIIKDLNTNLMWQDNNNSELKRNWKNAVNYCQELKLGKYDNWRLPSKDEFLKTIDNLRYNPNLKENIFKNISSDGYWSSTNHITRDDYACVLYFDYAYTYCNDKNNSYYVRCVRDIK